MPRPKKCRKISRLPKTVSFKPQGVPLCELEEIYLSLDAFEALRLVDYKKYSLEQAAQQMQISRHTFGRLLTQARQTLAKAIVEGNALYILYKHNTEHFHITTLKKEKIMSLIAISSNGSQLSDMVDPRFGRASTFILFNTENKETTVLENNTVQNMTHGAGIHTAEMIVNAGVSTVLSGRVGPKAYQVLENAGVTIIENMDGKSVGEAIEAYLAQ